MGPKCPRCGATGDSITPSVYDPSGRTLFCHHCAFVDKQPDELCYFRTFDAAQTHGACPECLTKLLQEQARKRTDVSHVAEAD